MRIFRLLIKDPKRSVLRGSVFLLMLATLMTAFSFAAEPGEEAPQFLFLTLRLKNGVVTLEKAAVAAGTLKPQINSSDAEAVVVALEEKEGNERWSLAMEDPSIQHLEYEDPDEPGKIKTKVVHLDDVEFIARVPLTAGVRNVAVYRKEKGVVAKNASPAEGRKLLGRMELPQEAIK